MSRNRMIKPLFWEDEKIGELSFMERLLFIGMWNFADDEGLIKAHSMYLKSQIFTYDDIKKAEIEKAIENLDQKKLIYLYSQNDQRFAWIINFRTHQRIDKPQKPTNPAPSLNDNKYLHAIGKRDAFVCYLCGKVCETIYFYNHINKTFEGSNNYPTNLKIVCISCNKEAPELINDIDIQGTFQESSENTPEKARLSKVKLSKVKISKDKSELFVPDSIEYRLSDYLLNFILKRNPNHKKPDIQKWSVVIEKMIRIDKRNPDDIKNVIEWCQNDTPDKQKDGTWKGWANNILSTKTLRDKFDKLFLKMKEDVEKPKLHSVTEHNLKLAEKFLRKEGAI